MKQKDTKETKFLLRIDPELKEKAEQLAKQDNRSLNGHIVSLVKKDITGRITNTQ